MGLFSIFRRSEGLKEINEEESKKEKKQHEWKDTNEKYKYVCDGGTAMCPYCSIQMAKIVVTSNDVSLQDKAWATIGDCDGKMNLDFKGQCLHPTQQKPSTPPPPCKAVISLGKWKGYADTYINDENALIVESTIPCLISGQDIIITHSGQRQEIEEVDPLEIKGLFSPIVYFSKPDKDKNSIFKVFTKEDKNRERCMPFIKDMGYPFVPEEDGYYVPYLRMWPAQKGERVFTLQCHVMMGDEKSEDSGELSFKLESEIDGLSLEYEKKEASLYDTFDLKITIANTVDRTRTSIVEKPLIVYAINNLFETEVGRIHLSVAPKDVFSEEEILKIENYFKSKPKTKYNHDCITAVRVGLEKILDTSLIRAIKKDHFHIWDLEDYLQKNGYSQVSITINFSNGIDERKFAQLLPPSEYPLPKIENTISNSLGYHLFAVGLYAHTEVLIINYCNPSLPTFSIYDQINYAGRNAYITTPAKSTKDLPIADINNAIFHEVANWKAFIIQSTQADKANVKALLIKVCRAFLFIGMLLNIISCNHSPSKQTTQNSLQTNYASEVHDTVFYQPSLFDLVYERLTSEFEYSDSIKTISKLYDTPKNISTKFISGKSVALDEFETVEPRVFFKMYSFKSDSALIQYAYFMKNNLFPRYELEYVDTLVYINVGGSDLNRLNSRMFKKENTLYFLCCHDSQFAERFISIMEWCDELDWEKIE